LGLIYKNCGILSTKEQRTTVYGNETRKSWIFGPNHRKTHRLWRSLRVHWNPRQISPVHALAADLFTIPFTILPATPLPTS
jgi:hypothetical protein